ncbi:hypothetical protein QQS21_000214 [Conoideocrella luteorostrata]|uniref:Uncharacterized protein n=1 Tax=Conoideocrella luteorostrata TaxID=1105319 RepID=A0AAJ0G2P4_9HYPO|nr:hypothetical protein QQS21_000214 [Conoideocrella luteorostrata]
MDSAVTQEKPSCSTSLGSQTDEESLHADAMSIPSVQQDNQDAQSTGSTASHPLHHGSTRPYKQETGAHQQQSSPQQARQSISSRHMPIFHPRTFDQICAEQAYLRLTLQSQTSRLCDLIGKYHLAELQSIHGESRKVKRLARKQIGLLRYQIGLAAEQEKTIFIRLNELLLEMNSRDARHRTELHFHEQAARLATSGPAHVQEHQPTSPSLSRLNGATTEFVPGKSRANNQAVPGVTISAAWEDSMERIEDDGQSNEFGNHGLEFSFEDNAEAETERKQRQCFTRDDCVTPTPSRRLSMPNMKFGWP